MIKTAIFGTSLKPNEYRIPIHPDHISHIPKGVLKNLYFEENYAAKFGFDLMSIEDDIAGILPREDLFKKCDVLVIPKICNLDLVYLRVGQIIYGWFHCIQNHEITQIAIDKKLTLIAFESMFYENGDCRHHIFHKNNEIAGFASVQHATQIRGVTGYYGGNNRGIVFGFGSTARGAVYGLIAQGITDITVYTKRPTHLVHQQIPRVKYKQFLINNGAVELNEENAFNNVIAQADVIVNCMLQDPNNPVMLIDDTSVKNLKNNAIVIDVSCDEGMGFTFAKPTSFCSPGFMIQNTNAYYYGVDHTPSLYWNTSSYQISEAILPYLKAISTEKRNYRDNQVLYAAVVIEDGNILIESVLNFQKREKKFPHKRLEG